MKQAQLRTLARQIIQKNIYMTLATQGAKPWAAPVFYCTDGRGSFYIASQPASRHIRQSMRTHRIAFAIFDSHAPEGRGVGVQAEAAIHQCTGAHFERALRHYHTNFFPATHETFTHGPYKLYRILVTKLYILDPDAPTDRRVKV